MKILDHTLGSEVDQYLNEFASIVSGQTVDALARGVDLEQDWKSQAEMAVSKLSYQQALANPGVKPPKLNAIFGETPGGKHFKDTLGVLLNCERMYTSAYTPHGFLGWHTDCDEPGYYIMFSFCEGPGSKFLWVEDGQVCGMDEPTGWTIKAGKVTADAPHFWHATLTTAPKWSIIMMWDKAADWQRACDVVTARSSLDPVQALILYGIFE